MRKKIVSSSFWLPRWSSIGKRFIAYSAETRVFHLVHYAQCGGHCPFHVAPISPHWPLLLQLDLHSTTPFSPSPLGLPFPSIPLLQVNVSLRFPFPPLHHPRLTYFSHCALPQDWPFCSTPKIPQESQWPMTAAKCGYCGLKKEIRVYQNVFGKFFKTVGSSGQFVDIHNNAN